MTNTINITKEIERIQSLPPITATKKATPEDMLRALKYLRSKKTAVEGATKKATQIKLSGKRVCELFESRRGAYLWVRKDIYKEAGLHATKNLKVSGNTEFYIAQYNTPDECLADYEILKDHCNV